MTTCAPALRQRPRSHGAGRAGAGASSRPQHRKNHRGTPASCREPRSPCRRSNRLSRMLSIPATAPQPGFWAAWRSWSDACSRRSPTWFAPAPAADQGTGCAAARAEAEAAPVREAVRSQAEWEAGLAERLDDDARRRRRRREEGQDTTATTTGARARPILASPSGTWRGEARTGRDWAGQGGSRLFRAVAKVLMGDAPAPPQKSSRRSGGNHGGHSSQGWRGG